VVDNTAIAITLNDPANGTTVEVGSPVNITFSEEPLEVYHNWDNATENATGYAGTVIPWGNGTHVLRLYVSDGLNWNDVAFVFEAVDPLIVITLRYPYEGLRTTPASLEKLFNSRKRALNSIRMTTAKKNKKEVEEDGTSSAIAQLLVTVVMVTHATSTVTHGSRCKNSCSINAQSNDMLFRDI